MRTKTYIELRLHEWTSEPARNGGVNHAHFSVCDFLRHRLQRPIVFALGIANRTTECAGDNGLRLCEHADLGRDAPVDSAEATRTWGPIITTSHSGRWGRTSPVRWRFFLRKIPALDVGHRPCNGAERIPRAIDPIGPIERTSMRASVGPDDAVSVIRFGAAVNLTAAPKLVRLHAETIQAEASWAMKYVGCQWRIIHRYRFGVDRSARIPDNRACQRHAGANPLPNQNLAGLAARPRPAERACQFAAPVDETGAPLATIFLTPAPQPKSPT